MRIEIGNWVAGLWLVSSVLGFAVSADTWQGNREGGGVVAVDPVTHKPTYSLDGVSRPLWDGVHEMEDGTVLLIRDGVAVPDERMLETWAQEPAQTGQKPEEFCRKLVRKVCGFHNECAGDKPCSLATQLQRLQHEEMRQAPFGHLSASAQECQKGLADPSMFPACEKAAQVELTPCGKLVRRVCGRANQCEQSPACDPARQLLQMEQGERLDADDPNAPTESAKQCRDAADNAYFAPCGDAAAAKH